MIITARKTSLLRPLLLAATLAAGFGTLWSVLALWVGTSVLQASAKKNRQSRERLVVTADGRPLVESTPLDNLSQVTYRGLNGRAHDDVERKDQLPGVQLFGDHESRYRFFLQPGWDQRIKVFTDEREPAAIWYFIHDGQPEGAGYFVGYERVSNRLIGYIGLSGFRAEPVPVDDRIRVDGKLALENWPWSSVPLSIWSGRQWTSRPGRWDVPPRLVHVPSGNLLRLVDLSARTVRTVLETPEPIVSVGVPSVSWYSGGESTKQRPILVRSGQRIDKLDHTYKVISTFTLPPEIDRQSDATWYDTDDGQAVVECTVPEPAGDAPDENVAYSRLYRIAADGAIRDSVELTLQTGANAPSEQAQHSLTALAVPSPAVYVLAESLMAMQANQPENIPSALGARLKHSWPWLAGVLALSSVLSAVAWLRARAFGRSPRGPMVWAGFVLLLGVPAFVGFLVHRPWPVREPCPHCNALCPRDRDSCSECGTPFPDPALKGIEISA